MSDEEEPARKRVRAYDQSHLEIVLRVRQFFENERTQHRRINLNNVVERTSAATGVNKNLVCKIRTIEDVLNWKKKPGVSVKVPQTHQIPDNFCSVIRQVVRDICLERERVPTLDRILEKLREKTVQDFEHLNLFHDGDIPSSESPIWIWSRTSLYRFMKSTGFIYGDRVSHYEYIKNRADVISIRDNYLDWIS